MLVHFKLLLNTYLCAAGASPAARVRVVDPSPGVVVVQVVLVTGDMCDIN